MTVSLQQGGRPPYVRFKKGSVEDRTATLAAGHYVSRSVDYAEVRQSGGKDSVDVEVNDWLERISHNPGYPREWVDGFRKAYEMWKVGQDAPLNGSPIREWGMISPEQREHLLQLTVCTVEDLAAANESTLMRIGMGARELKQKAQKWLETSWDIGKTTAEIMATRAENAALKDEMQRLREMIYANQNQNYTAVAVPNNGLPPALTAGNLAPMPQTASLPTMPPEALPPTPDIFE